MLRLVPMTEGTAQLPAPLVPPEVDLRGYGFMPLYGHHLLNSDFHAKASDAGWRAGVTLWWAAWNQVPAASLPNDAAVLAQLAGMPRNMKAWGKVRQEALHGFVLCSDGRFYHKFLAPHAIEAWHRRKAERDKKARYRESQSVRDQPLIEGLAPDGDVPGTVPATGAGRLTGTGTGTGTPLTPKGAGFQLPAWVPQVEWAGYVEMRRKMRKPMTQRAMELAVRELDTLRKAGQDPAAVLDQSVMRGWQGLFSLKPNGVEHKAAASATPVEKPWWSTDAGIKDKGRELGVQWLPRETFAKFHARVLVAAGDGPWLAKIDGLVATYMTDVARERRSA